MTETHNDDAYDLGGPFHIWLQGEFLGIRNQMNELMKSVTINGLNQRDQSNEIARLSANFSEHVKSDEQAFATIQEKLADLRSAMIRRQAAWAGPKNLIIFASAAIAPILAVIFSIWNPFHNN